MTIIGLISLDSCPMGRDPRVIDLRGNDNHEIELEMANYRFIVIVFIVLLLINFHPFSSSAQEDPYFIKARDRMVKYDLSGRDIKDKKVLDVMSKIPRHLFVSKDIEKKAYSDYPLPIGEGQTISQPYVVALMTQSLGLKGNERVLEIGTGSGYQAAVLAEFVKEVYTIEIRDKLTKNAEKTLNSLGYKNVKVKTGDGYFGWKEYAPFDAIMITCAVNHIPSSLIDQLSEGGRLILPLGSTTYYQTLTLVKSIKGKLTVEHITDVRFVPMTGEAEKKR
ncbi:MAG: protein-L-isoaspartate(D-aspartate) O-methyltransferase [Nitrospirota bacterium]